MFVHSIYVMFNLYSIIIILYNIILYEYNMQINIKCKYNFFKRLLNNILDIIQQKKTNTNNKNEQEINNPIYNYIYTKFKENTSNLEKFKDEIIDKITKYEQYIEKQTINKNDENKISDNKKCNQISDFVCPKIDKNTFNLNDLNNNIMTKNKDIINEIKKNIKSTNTFTFKTTNNNDMSMNINKFFRDIFTKFNVYKLHNTNLYENIEIMYIHIINMVMKQLIVSYNKSKNDKYDIKFVLRGGSTLRMYENSFKTYFGNRINNIFKKHIDKYFALSDYDFLLYFKKNNGTMDIIENSKIADELQYISYYGLSIARFLIIKYGMYLEPLCNFNNDYLNYYFGEIYKELSNSVKSNEEIKHTLNKYNIVGFMTKNKMYIDDNNYDEFNKILLNDNLWENNEFTHYNFNSEKVMNIIKYMYNKNLVKSDFFIKKENDDINIINIEHLKKDFIFSDKSIKLLSDDNVNNKNHLFVSNNTDIKNDDTKIHFKLSRLMYYYIIILKNNENNKYSVINTSSELYDISISLMDDAMSDIYNNNYIQYHYEIKNKIFSDENINDFVYIPDIKIHLNDLHIIMYEYYIFPWIDEKYEKRIKRLYLLLFIIAYKQYIKKIDNVLEIIYDIKTYIKNFENIDTIKNEDKTKLFVSYIYINNKIFNSVNAYKNIDDMLYEKNIKKYNEYKKNVIEYCETLLNICDEIHNDNIGIDVNNNLNL